MFKEITKVIVGIGLLTFTANPVLSKTAVFETKEIKQENVVSDKIEPQLIAKTDWISTEDQGNRAQFQFNLYKLPFSDKSRLFILDMNSEFTPSVYNNNGDFYADMADFEVNALEYRIDSTYQRSGKVSYINALPDTSPVTTTFTTTLGTTVTFQGSFGFQGMDFTSSSTTGFGFSSSYSISSITADPHISAQSEPYAANRSWVLRYYDDKARNSTYKLHSIMLFEKEIHGIAGKDFADPMLLSFNLGFDCSATRGIFHKKVNSKIDKTFNYAIGIDDNPEVQLIDNKINS